MSYEAQRELAAIKIDQLRGDYRALGIDPDYRPGPDTHVIVDRQQGWYPVSSGGELMVRRSPAEIVRRRKLQ